MANAKKCDRCGGYYDKNMVTLPEKNTIVRTVYFETINGYNSGTEYDLCDKCFTKLFKFLGGAELGQ